MSGESTREPRKGVLTIVGPTASGKTAVAIDVARRLGGEIVSADSRQIYRMMDIGTAKPTPEERAAVRHHLIDIVDPNDAYDASRFAAEAEDVIAKLKSDGIEPIVVGGTGFYIASLFEGLFEGPGREDDVRRALKARLTAEGAQQLHRELRLVDPEAAGRIHPNDGSRVVRALEVYISTGRAMSEWQSEERRDPAYSPRYFGLSLERPKLYERIGRRVDDMIAAGLVDEVRLLSQTGKLSADAPAASAVGYRELLEHLDRGERTLAEVTADIKRNTRRYAKRQITWFASLRAVDWIDVGALGPARAAAEIVERWTAARDPSDETA